MILLCPSVTGTEGIPELSPGSQEHNGEGCGIREDRKKLVVHSRWVVLETLARKSQHTNSKSWLGFWMSKEAQTGIGDEVGKMPGSPIQEPPGKVEGTNRGGTWSSQSLSAGVMRKDCGKATGKFCQ